MSTLYTVILDREVPTELRPELIEKLETRFKLNGEQARKLASRRPGRLLRPTGQARAESLLGLYQALGLTVHLEAVAEGDAEVATGELNERSQAPAGAETRGRPGVAVLEAPAKLERAVTEPAAPTVAPAELAPQGPAPTGSAPTEPAPTEQPAPAQPALGAGAVHTVTFTGEEVLPEEVPLPRRRSLRQQLILTAVGPLLAGGLLSAGAITLLINASQTRLIREGASALAATIGQGVQIGDVNAVDAQLRSLVRQPKVGFVSVKTPDGLTFFASKHPESDYLFGSEVDAWLVDHPQAGRLVTREVPAGRAQSTLETLKSSGVTLPGLIARARARTEQPGAGVPATTTYEVQNVGVYQGREDRVVGAATAVSGPAPLFTVAVGMVSNDAAAVSRTVLGVQLLIALLITALAAWLAARGSARIVRPIEALVAHANEISLGKLDVPVIATRNDEIGDLARALERMRLSLESALARLRKRRGRG